jgi:hypothetical protein
MPTAVAVARFLSDYDSWWWRSKLDGLQDVPTPSAHLTSIFRAP